MMSEYVLNITRRPRLNFHPLFIQEKEIKILIKVKNMWLCVLTGKYVWILIQLAIFNCYTRCKITKPNNVEQTEKLLWKNG